MKKPELKSTRIWLILLGVILAIIISLQTSAVSMHRFSDLDAIKENPKNVLKNVQGKVSAFIVSFIK